MNLKKGLEWLQILDSSRDNSNHPKLEKMYNMVPSLHLGQLDHKAKLFKGSV